MQDASNWSGNPRAQFSAKPRYVFFSLLMVTATYLAAYVMALSPLSSWR